MALTVKEQYTRVLYLGFSFMIMFTSFNSLQNIVSKLYEEYHYNNLGQTALLFLYGSFGVATLFSSFIVKKLGYKKAMFMSSLGYALFEAIGLLIVTNIDIPHWLVWGIVIVGSMINGVAASTLWVAQGAYTSQVADENRKSELFGLFWAIMMSSQIWGNLITTFVLGKLSNLVYFIILTIIGSSSSILFLFLPSVSNVPETAQSNTTFKQEVGKVWAIMTNRKYTYLNIYFLFPGLVVACYAGFLYKVVKSSLVQDEGESEDDFNHRVNFSQGLVFITLGVSQMMTGLLMNRFAEKFCKFKLAIVGTLLVELAAFVTFVSYFTKSFPLCFVGSFCWGVSETFLQTNTGGLISKVFPGRVEAFSVYRVFFSIGVVAVNLLNIGLSSQPSYIFLSIIVVFQVIIAGVSVNLRELDNPRNNQQADSLITSAENEKGINDL